MDEVLAKFDTALGTPKETDDDKTNFDGLYKNWGRLGNQEERRKDLLEVQKLNRQNKLDYHRGILELVSAVEEDYQVQSYHRQNRAYRPSIYVAGFHKVSPSYRDVLMLSEWLIEQPEDFHEEWCLVPCPKGVRLLLVASRGTTRFYTKCGRCKFECRTALPGGNPCDTKTKMYQCCVLDVVYVEKNNTIYVLDLLAWNNQPMTDCETEFRQYWLDSKFSEMPDLKIVSKKNHSIFTLLPKSSCSVDGFNQFMARYPPFECNFPPLDGLLFYHKRAHYVGGETPLVGWLYPYMVPEIFGPEVTLHETYAIKPENYVDQATFIQKFEEKLSKRKRAQRSKNTSVSDNKDNSNVETMESTEDGQGDTATNMESEDTTETTPVENPATMESENTETIVEAAQIAVSMESESPKHEISTPEKIAESVLNND